MSDDTSEVDKLRRVLEWAFINGVTMHLTGELRDGGCGCCSSRCDSPDDLRDVVEAVRTRLRDLFETRIGQ